MFEKEAEEYATRECCETCNKINHFCEEKCECWTFARKGAEFGYNKANEWHYVKSGDLPAEDTRVLALMAGGEVCIAHFYRKNVWDKIGIVIAWKEIVPPKEIKEK